MAEQFRDKVVIEDQFINKMLTNPLYTTAFPFLKQWAAVAKANEAACRGCGNRKGRTKAIDYTAIKRTLVAMPADKQRKLLDLAKANSVRIWFVNERKETVKVTINRGP